MYVHTAHSTFGIGWGGRGVALVGHGSLLWTTSAHLTNCYLSLQWQDIGSSLVMLHLQQVRVFWYVWAIYLVVVWEGCLRSFKNRLAIHLQKIFWIKIILPWAGGRVRWPPAVPSIPTFLWLWLSTWMLWHSGVNHWAMICGRSQVVKPGYYSWTCGIHKLRID